MYGGGRMGVSNAIISKSIISADSHVMEPPNTYIDRIDPKYRDRAPHVHFTAEHGDVYLIDGMKDHIPIGLVAGAGKTAEELAGAAARAKFDELHRGGWDPKARIEDQDRDGVYAEVIYPSVGSSSAITRTRITKRLASTPTTSGSVNTAPRTPRGCWAVVKLLCVHPRKALRICIALRHSGYAG